MGGELENRIEIPEFGTIRRVRDIVVLFIHVVVTLVRLPMPGGLRSLVAESVLVRHQLLILNRGRKRAPNLRLKRTVCAHSEAD